MIFKMFDKKFKIYFTEMKLKEILSIILRFIRYYK